MPLELQLIRASDFVRLDARGQFDFESTRSVLIGLAEACRKRAIEQALLDVRGARSNLTPNDLAALVKAFSEAPVSARLRLGILHDGHQQYRTKLFVFFSALRSRKVRAFEKFEEAVIWLSTPGSTAAETAPREGEVPIRSGKRSKTKTPVREDSSDQ